MGVATLQQVFGNSTFDWGHGCGAIVTMTRSQSRFDHFKNHAFVTVSSTEYWR
jgi:hypothetical protein